MGREELEAEEIRKAMELSQKKTKMTQSEIEE